MTLTPAQLEEFGRGEPDAIKQKVVADLARPMSTTSAA